MAKSRGRPKTDRDDVTIRVSRSVAGKLKLLAGSEGKTVGEVVDELLGPPLDKAYVQLMRKLEDK